MVDPRSNDLFIVTKPRDTTPTVYRAKAPMLPNTTTVLEDVGKLTVFEQGKRRNTLVTAGDISPDGGQILIRNLHERVPLAPTPERKCCRRVETRTLRRPPFTRTTG